MDSFIRQKAFEEESRRVKALNNLLEITKYINSFYRMYSTLLLKNEIGRLSRDIDLKNVLRREMNKILNMIEVEIKHSKMLETHFEDKHLLKKAAFQKVFLNKTGYLIAVGSKTDIDTKILSSILYLKFDAFILLMEDLCVMFIEENKMSIDEINSKLSLIKNIEILMPNGEIKVLDIFYAVDSIARNYDNNDEFNKLLEITTYRVYYHMRHGKELICGMAETYNLVLDKDIEIEMLAYIFFETIIATDMDSCTNDMLSKMYSKFVKEKSAILINKDCFNEEKVFFEEIVHLFFFNNYDDDTKKLIRFLNIFSKSNLKTKNTLKNIEICKLKSLDLVKRKYVAQKNISSIYSLILKSLNENFLEKEIFGKYKQLKSLIDEYRHIKKEVTSKLQRESVYKNVIFDLKLISSAIYKGK